MNPKNDLVVDCISRQSVLDKIQRLIDAEQNNIDENGDYMNYARERVNAYEAIQFFIENDCLCPSVTPQELRWIPVNERLPEEDTDVLVTLKCGLIGIMQKKLADDDNGEPCYIWQDFEGEEHEVIAWMPLPKAYKVEDGT